MKNLNLIVLLTILSFFGCKESEPITPEFTAEKMATIDVYIQATNSDKYERLELGIDKLQIFSPLIDSNREIFRQLTFHPMKEEEPVFLNSFQIPTTSLDTFALQFVLANITIKQKDFQLEILSNKEETFKEGTFSSFIENPKENFEENSTTKVIFELDVDQSIIQHDGFPKYDFKPKIELILD